MATEEQVPLSDRTRAIIEQMGESLRDDGLLPLRIFNDEEIFQAEKELVFGESWVFIGHETEIPEPGDYARRYIADTPVIFTRDEGGDVQVLFDSCRHRGTKVCRAEQGNTSHFRCPYHGWTYNNKGELVGVPHKQEAFDELDIDNWGLAKPRFDSYHGLVFATLSDETPPLDDYLGRMKWYMDVEFALADNGLEVYDSPTRYTMRTNWKTGAENFAGDNYHALPTHQSAMEVGYSLPDHGVHEEWKRVQVAFDDLPEMGHAVASVDIETEEGLYFDYPDEVEYGNTLSDGQLAVARDAILHVGTVFPNFSFIHQTIGNGELFRPHCNIRKWRPLGPDTVELWSWQLVPKDAPEEMKREMYDAGQSTFSPAGTYDQDDVSVWDGIAESAGSTFTLKNNIQQNYQMGNSIVDGMSEAEPDEDWPGPGTAYVSSGGFDESYARSFHQRWYTEMNSVERSAAERR